MVKKYQLTLELGLVVKATNLSMRETINSLGFRKTCKKNKKIKEIKWYQQYDDYSHWMDSRVISTHPTDRLWRNSAKSETCEKLEAQVRFT